MKRTEKPDNRNQFLLSLKKLKNAGINTGTNLPQISSGDAIDSLQERVQRMMGLINRTRKNPTRMVYFIMYDIENSKVRTRIAKYLINKGCLRLQKSVYLAETERATYHEIHKTLAEVMEAYHNLDSIVFVPISTDEVKAMRVIGRDLELDVLMQTQNTLFF